MKLNEFQGVIDSIFAIGVKDNCYANIEAE